MAEPDQEPAGPVGLHIVAQGAGNGFCPCVEGGAPISNAVRLCKPGNIIRHAVRRKIVDVFRYVHMATFLGTIKP